MNCGVASGHRRKMLPVHFRKAAIALAAVALAATPLRLANAYDLEAAAKAFRETGLLAPRPMQAPVRKCVTGSMALGSW